MASNVGGDAGRAAAPADSGELYEKRQKVYSRAVRGRFDTLRRISVFVLLGLYYLMPWVRWDDRQAVLFDLAERKFYVFGLVLWPQDFIYLTWLLVAAGLALFFFTSLAGRLWCGYACPQTVWTETFIWLERLVEGDRGRQVKLARMPWNRERITKTLAKQSLWVSFALWTGATFVGYFVPITSLAYDAVHLSLGGAPLFWALFYGGATYLNAGYMREQVCKYMCPYARIQSALIDRDTLVITYDAARGEARGPRARNVDPKSKGLGDCVDCTVCVQVCPTGIDIRNGLQNECIGCAACIDACDDVMDKVGYPRGLIRYTTLSALEGKPTRIMRGRTWVGLAMLTGVLAAGIVGLALRKPVGLDVMRDRNALYRETNDGWVENVYSLRILNKDQRDHVFVAGVSGIPGAEITEGTAAAWPVAAGQIRIAAVRIRVPQGKVRGGHDLAVSVTSRGEPAVTVTEEARFLAP